MAFQKPVQRLASNQLPTKTLNQDVAYANYGVKKLNSGQRYSGSFRQQLITHHRSLIYPLLDDSGYFLRFAAKIPVE